MTLADYLSQNSLTATEFAALVECDESAVVRWLGGSRTPNANTMQRIIAATGGAVTPNDFFELPAAKVAE